METLKENRLTGLEFTTQNSTKLSLESVPITSDPLDLETESKNLRVWGNGNGFEYNLPVSDLARIQSWEDEGGTIRLAVVEKVDGNWPVYRNPTLAEMVRFVRVARYTMPDTPQTNILTAQVEARIYKQAKATEERANALRELVDEVSVIK